MKIAIIILSLLIIFFFILSVIFFIEARKNRDLYLFILKEYNKLATKTIELNQKMDDVINSFNK